MATATRQIVAAGPLLCCVLLGQWSDPGSAQGELPPAAEALEESAVSAGLAVVVGTTDGVLEAELTNGGKMLVQGLALSDEAATKARAHLFSQKLYGLATVSRVQSARTLPYYDRLINLLIADLDTLGADAPPLDELMRVLGYEGVAYLRKDGVWKKHTRPMSSDVDAWTHTLHDASRDSLARDLVVSPPNAARWIAGPAVWKRIGGPRTGDGVFVQVLPAIRRVKRTGGLVPNPACIWARDVHSGVLLWKRPICTYRHGSGDYPQDGLGESIVAAEGRVFCYRVCPPEPVVLTAWNIRTGELETEFSQSVSLPSGTDPRGRRPVAEEDWNALTVSSIAVHQGRVIQLFKNHLFVMDARTGKVLWKKDAPAESWWRWAVAGDGKLLILRGKVQFGGGRWGPHGRVHLIEAKAIEAFRLEDGRAVWTFTDFGPDMKYMCGLWGYAEGYLPLKGRATIDKGGGRPHIALLDTETGQRVWETEAGRNEGGEASSATILDDKLLWYAYDGCDVHELATGKLMWSFGVHRHDSCASSVATPNYVLLLKAFVPLDQSFPVPRGQRPIYYINRNVQIQCRDKVAPSYGSIYDTQQACRCEAFLPANSARYGVSPTPPVTDATRLRQDAPPALGAVQPQTAARGSTVAIDWLKPESVEDPWLWSYSTEHIARLGERRHALVWPGYQRDTTEPVQAADLSLVAHVHEHRMAALRDGTEVWNFVAGGRIGEPPVVHRDLAIFGSHDGYVYAVRLADGKPVWRFLAAPADKRHVAFGQVESAWPVFNVVVHNGRLYFAAGRHPELDGGIHVYCLDPVTGDLNWHVRHLRGLTTGQNTWRRSASSSQEMARGSTPEKPNTFDGCFVIADPITIKDNKIYMRLSPVVDLSDPQDTIVNSETLVPPGIGRSPTESH
jgi:outer membrane protein assembly factor BamB